MGQTSTLVLHKGYDWGLSYEQKVICAWICAACSFIPWIGYSTPNTMYVAHLIGQSLNLQLFGFSISGSYVLQSVAICINLAEYAFIHLCIWKSGIIHWIGLVVTIAASCSGSFIFHDQAQDAVRFKKEEISSYQNIGETFQNLSDAQDEIIAARREQIKTLSNQEIDYQRRVNIGEIGKLPDWLSFRQRQAAEDINRALAAKSAYTDSLKKYTFSGIEKESEAGYLVDFGPQAKKISLGVTIFIEAFLVFFGFLAVLLWDSAAQDKVKNKKQDEGSNTIAQPNEFAFVPAGDERSNPAVLVQERDATKRPIGFSRHEDGNTTINLRVNSEEQICYFYDLALEKGSKFSVKDISRITGKTETWVRKCLQNNNRMPKKGEA